MILFYQISIQLYFFAIKVSALFNPKAKQWVDGRKKIFESLENLREVENIYWFHCASLGELEQGKPVIEKVKEKDKSIKILLTFFSPSGYEKGVNYDKADFIFYLPSDSKINAEKFITIVNPKKVFFIKYEFWYHYLFQLHKNNTPTYLVSGVFRKKQLFFKWYGGIYRKMLSFFTYFFVQNTSSLNLLNSLGYDNAEVSGDTRLDRVYENSKNPEPPALIKKFKGNKKIIIVGSSWSFEEKIICEFINSTTKDFKYIIAPHNISTKHIIDIEALLNKNYIKYSDATYESINDFNILIIDNVGILANTYQFSDIAFIGGGFTGALHNILEPASFGNVVLFGPKHEKFHEAEELMSIGGAFEIDDTDDLIAITNHLLIDNNLQLSQTKNLSYVKEGCGAAQLIIKHTEK